MHEQPAYLKTYKEKKLDELIKITHKMLESCMLCPRECKVNRLEGEVGFCKTGSLPIISSYSPHFGEETPLVGMNGSGTIFFTHCNLGCVFCQNYDVSHLGYGNETPIKELARMMLTLQKRECHNINFVTPTHIVPFILAALKEAIEGGLKIPLVYNCGGYESLEVIKRLDGIFDIYMPDFKCWDEKHASMYSNAPRYPEIAKIIIKEMHRQVGELIIDDYGIARRGLLIRHLVLPEDIAGTYDVCKWIAEELSPNTYVNIMDQYRPCHKAYSLPKINRGITALEFQRAIKWAKDAGLKRLDKEGGFL